MNRRPIWQEQLLELLCGAELRRKWVLDVGAGRGDILMALLNYDIVPRALDISDEAIAFLKQRGIIAHKVDISRERFPYEDSQFDYVICTEVIEHLAWPQHALAEMYRVLKPGGKLFVSTHNSFNLYMRLRYSLGQIPTPDLDVTATGQHMRLISYRVLVLLLKGAGFAKIANQSSLVFFARSPIRCWTPMTSLFARHFLVVCTKE